MAPSQIEMNYTYTEATIAADQVQLYKLIARQVAAQMDLTASFLPKPVANVNGSGCHTNLSITKKGKNIFHDRNMRRSCDEFTTGFDRAGCFSLAWKRATMKVFSVSGWAYRCL